MARRIKSPSAAASTIGGEVDGYGNLYQTDGSGSGTGVPGIYGAIAYAGGPGITNFLSSGGVGGIYTKNVNAGYSPTETLAAVPAGDTLLPNMLPLTYGNSYNGQIYDIIRPNYLDADMYGSLWFTDQHYPLVVRLDQFTGAPITMANTQPGALQRTPLWAMSTIRTAPSANTVRWPRSLTRGTAIYGSTSPSNNIVTFGPQSYDPKGDNCPAQVTNYGGSHGTIAEDNLPNAYVIGQGSGRVYEISTGTAIPVAYEPAHHGRQPARRRGNGGTDLDPVGPGPLRCDEPSRHRVGRVPTRPGIYFGERSGTRNGNIAYTHQCIYRNLHDRGLLDRHHHPRNSP